MVNAANVEFSPAREQRRRRAGALEIENMSDNPMRASPRFNGAQMARLIGGIVVFALLMGIRDAFAAMWMRALAAAGAGAILAIAVLPLQNRKRSQT